MTDWLTGEAPFDKRSSEDAFFVARDAAHRRLARACARAIRAGVLDTESYSSDAAADEVLASFVEGEGGVASDAYALRWCLFHMKRSRSESEAVAVACSLSYVQKRVEGGDIVSFVADLDVLEGRDALAVRLLGAVAERAVAGRAARRAVLAAADAARRCGVVSCRATPGRRCEASREQAAALGRATDGSDGGWWGGAVSD